MLFFCTVTAKGLGLAIENGGTVEPSLRRGILLLVDNRKGKERKGKERKRNLNYKIQKKFKGTIL